MDVQKLLQMPEYEFLHHLERPVLFMTLGGSYAYGTNREGSDIDVRGCVLNRPEELLGLSKFDAFADRNTDTTIYGFNKLISMLIDCNPSTMELLFCKPEHYFMVSNEGHFLLDSRNLFLSQRAIYSFGGYANRMLRQLRTFLADHDPTPDEREEEFFRTAQHMIEGCQYRYTGIPSGTFSLYLDKARDPGKNMEVFLDVHADHVSLREINSVLNELGSTRESYEKLCKRNTKKDEVHLNKHIMHLCRLYLMIFDILEKGQFSTYREADHNFLMDVRNGKFLQNGVLTEEFEELLVAYEKRLQYDKQNTSLPEQPDIKKIEELMVEINRKAVM